MSIMVLKALADSLSVGEIKFPAALFTTTLGIPNSSTQESTAFLKLKKHSVKNEKFTLISEKRRFYVKSILVPKTAIYD